MRRYWSQIAMLLLGITLTVGFYEGRKLVKNTAKALSAATSLSSSASGPRHRGDDPTPDEASDPSGDESDIASADDDRGDRHRRSGRSDRLTPSVRGSADGRVELRGGNLLRQRQRQRLAGRPGGPTGPAVTPPPAEEPGDEQVDTGKTEKLPAP